jgi:ribosomal protein L37E
MQTTSEKRRNKDLCQYCSTHPPAPDKKGCSSCLSLNRRERKEKRDALYQQGLCAYCGSEPHEKLKMGCSTCNLVARLRTSRAYQRKKQELTAP